MNANDSLMVAERQAAAVGWLEQTDGPCRVKLCGMYRDEDIVALNAARPDLCGFIFGYPKSHRNVTTPVAKRLAAQVDERIYKTLVVVDLNWQRAAYHAAALRMDIVQLHGDQDNEYITGLRMRMHGGIIQAFRVRTAGDIERANRSAAHMVLLDAGQGSGETFDWSLIEGIRRPYILAGGLGPDNVAEVVRTLHPWGVDMSSGIETDRKKDPDKMAAAVAAVRSCNE